MASERLKTDLRLKLDEIRSQGLSKDERYIFSQQGVNINVRMPYDGQERKVINMCANNYLGLSSHPEMIAAAHKALDERGYGMSSVRFICGTQDLHHQLEAKMSEFLGIEATILFSSCFDANGALFEALFDDQDVLIPDKLIHASLIDGIKLCKASRDIYEHSDMAMLEEKLIANKDKRYRVIVTDGVFSMDGDMAKLDIICDLADKYDALVVVDDSHASGFIGKTGRGTHEHCGVMGRVDVITTTFGKALGGASGGCISASKEIVTMCRQKARPYLFSNSLAPSITAGTMKVLELLSKSTELRDKLEWNAEYFRKHMQEAGFNLVPGNTPIVPVMLGDPKLAQEMSRELLGEGIYAIAFSYPVVPKGKDRIRCQLSAAHNKEHIDIAIQAFIKVGKKLGVIS